MGFIPERLLMMMTVAVVFYSNNIVMPCLRVCAAWVRPGVRPVLLDHK